MQIEGVRSVMTELDVRGRQRLIIFTDEVDHGALLRRMAAELRKPLEPGAVPLANAPVVPDSLIVANGVVNGTPAVHAIAIATQPIRDADVMSLVRKFVYGLLAAGSLGMAWVGLLVPGIPTVPFVILAATFAAKSSRSFHERLKRARVFGPMIRDWDTYGAVQPIVKVQAAIATLVIVTVTIIVAQPSPAMLTMIGVMCVVSLVIVARIPVIETDPISDDTPERLATLPAVA